MIRGGFNSRRPLISGLLLFSEVGTSPVSCRFLVDTGADRTLVVPSDYEHDGYSYQDFRDYPLADSRGVGGVLEGRIVPARMLLRKDDGSLQQIRLDVEVARPTPDVERIPSLLGRDVTDLFRLVVDRTVNLVALEDAADAAAFDAWPDERDGEDGP